MWFGVLSPVQTSSCCRQRRWCLCVVCSSPKSLLAALWRETWAPGRGSPAASLISAARRGEQCQWAAAVMPISYKLLVWLVCIWTGTTDYRAISQNHFLWQQDLFYHAVRTHNSVLALWLYNTVAVLKWFTVSFPPCHRNVKFRMLLILKPSRSAELVSV